MDAVYALRHVVFVDEQRVPVQLERDELDERAVHVLARRDGVPVGTARLVVGDDGVGVLGRLAVLPQERGAGLGAEIVRTLEYVAWLKGLVSVALSAQTHAMGFYERFGYTAYGTEFDDAGIPHRPMRKVL
ncbi:MAG: GNAT family N-acetyltransferase [Carbonactinosporaceae bacterium]